MIIYGAWDPVSIEYDTSLCLYYHYAVMNVYGANISTLYLLNTIPVYACIIIMQSLFIYGAWKHFDSVSLWT